MATGLNLDLLKLGAKPKAAAHKPAEDRASTVAKVAVTPAAAAAIKAELTRRETTNEKSGLRLGVKAGGCSGLSYVMQFEDEPRADDKIAELDGARVYVDPKSHVYLAGTELDFLQTLMKRGFEVKNPQQKSACGCGESFTI